MQDIFWMIQNFVERMFHNVIIAKLPPIKILEIMSTLDEINPEANFTQLLRSHIVLS